jgi:hypothetical protein
LKKNAASLPQRARWLCRRARQVFNLAAPGFALSGVFGIILVGSFERCATNY